MEAKTAAAAGAGAVTLPMAALFGWLNTQIDDLDTRIRQIEVQVAVTQQDVEQMKESAEEIHDILNRAFPRTGTTPGG
jgi:outer membrane murein-binding lipoprotein Lpp